MCISWFGARRKIRRTVLWGEKIRNRRRSKRQRERSRARAPIEKKKIITGFPCILCVCCCPFSSRCSRRAVVFDVCLICTFCCVPPLDSGRFVAWGRVSCGCSEGVYHGDVGRRLVGRGTSGGSVVDGGRSWMGRVHGRLFCYDESLLTIQARR